MKKISVKMGGKVHSLAATWGASMEIAREVADPALISTEVAKTEIFAEQGVYYRPRFEFGAANSVQILGIALRANGYEYTDEEVGEEMMAQGIFTAIEKAAAYIAAMVDAGPEKNLPTPKKKPAQTGSKS